MVPRYGDSFVLISGNKNVMGVCKEYGFRKAVHVEELLALMPHLSPSPASQYPRERTEARKEAVLSRLGLSESDLIA